jgi:hypothetical protein
VLKDLKAHKEYKVPQAQLELLVFLVLPVLKEIMEQQDFKELKV